jgi:ribosomal 30S subunit maturation factor RimM
VSRKKYLKLEDTEWYIDDVLGLRYLDEQGRFIKLHMPGDHDLFSMQEADEMFPSALML